MRRPAVAAIALVGVVGAAAVGWVAALQIRSPAQLAAEAEPPEPSAITVPVERRVLSADVVTRGTVRFDTPATVKLGGAPVDGTAAVVTRLPARGDPVEEGAVLLQVSGRPVLVLEGLLPMYRTIELGSVGDDVLQLEVALARLGHDVGQIDGTYDAATAGAVVQWYADVGFPAQGPSDAEQDALTAARERVRAAESAVRDAQAQLERARDPVEQSVLLGARSAVRQARDQVVATDAAAAEALATARADAAAAVVAVNEAQDALEAARATPAAQPGPVEPDPAPARPVQSGPWRPGPVQPGPAQPEQPGPEQPGPDQPGTREERIAEAEDVLAAAQAELQRANAAVATVAARNVADAGAARDALALAEAQLAETLAAPDTSFEVSSVEAAVDERDTARAELNRLVATTGIIVPASEVVFLSGLPLRVEAVAAQLGDDATGDLLAVAGSRQAIDASIPRGDVPLLAVDMPVVIESEQLDISVPGTISLIAEEPGTHDVDAQRHFLEVVPDTFMEELTDASVRITIPVEATDGEVLVVPVAALSSSPTGEARVERAGPSGDVDDVTLVEVRTGLSSGGMVEIRPVAGDLEEGDRVVVGRDG